jgi:hypothetical protein
VFSFLFPPDILFSLAEYTIAHFKTVAAAISVNSRFFDVKSKNSGHLSPEGIFFFFPSIRVLCYNAFVKDGIPNMIPKTKVPNKKHMVVEKELINEEKSCFYNNYRCIRAGIPAGDDTQQLRRA